MNLFIAGGQSGESCFCVRASRRIELSDHSIDPDQTGLSSGDINEEVLVDG